MIFANKKKVELTGNKEELKEELENMFMVLTVASELFTVKELTYMIKRKRKIINKFIEYYHKKKRMKELDEFLEQIRRNRNDI